MVMCHSQCFSTIGPPPQRSGWHLGLCKPGDTVVAARALCALALVASGIDQRTWQLSLKSDSELARATRAHDSVQQG